MKTISIKNPYAKLICEGIKDVENRTWKTNYRGKVLIHVPKKVIELNEAFTDEQFDFLTEQNKKDIIYDLDVSCIIGEVEIVDCIKNDDSIWALPNHWHWILDNAQLYEYIYPNVKGKLSFWNFETENAPRIIVDGVNTWCHCDNPKLHKHGVVRGLANCLNCGEAYYH